MIKKWVCNKRLGHANWRLISKLSKSQLVKGLPDIDYHSAALCGACQKGKIVKTSFKSKDIVSTSRPLELLHIDLFGPVTTESLYGTKYGLVIVDDYSRWTCVKFIRSNDYAYDVFSSFCTQIQFEKEMNILKVRSVMVENLKMSHLNLFVKNMESSMNSLLLELHNKMGL